MSSYLSYIGNDLFAKGKLLSFKKLNQNSVPERANCSNIPEKVSRFTVGKVRQPSNMYVAPACGLIREFP